MNRNAPMFYQAGPPFAYPPMAPQTWGWANPGGYQSIRTKTRNIPGQEWVADPFKIWYPGLVHPYGALKTSRSKDATLYRHLGSEVVGNTMMDRLDLVPRGSRAMDLDLDDEFGEDSLFGDVETEVLEALGIDAEAFELLAEDPEFGGILKGPKALFKVNPDTGKSGVETAVDKVKDFASNLVRKIESTAQDKRTPEPPRPIQATFTPPALSLPRLQVRRAPPPPQGISTGAAVGLALGAVALGAAVTYVVQQRR